MTALDMDTSTVRRRNFVEAITTAGDSVRFPKPLGGLCGSEDDSGQS
jgi:hypothetical protein